MNIVVTGNVFPMGRHLAYGGERMVMYLAEALAKRGHEILMIAREGSSFAGMPIRGHIRVGPLDNKVDVHFEALTEFMNTTGYEPDVYMCNYFGDGFDPMARQVAPVFTEFPWGCWAHCKPFWKDLVPQNIVSCSRVLQQDFFNRGVLTSMIHYGLPGDLYPFQPESDNYVVWIGKVEGGKRPDLAIELALASGMKIVVMGPPYNTGCFWQQVQPYLDKYPDKVFWVRGVDDAQKYKIMSRARCFISSNDNTWKEHFGIVNIEALAMGVPILGFNRIGQDCAIKTDTIIEDGLHGFLLNYKDSNDVAEILEKGTPLLQKIGDISREECRKQFDTEFTVDLMAERYEWLFSYIRINGPVSLVEVPF